MKIRLNLTSGIKVKMCHNNYFLTIQSILFCIWELWFGLVVAVYQTGSMWGFCVMCHVFVAADRCWISLEINKVSIIILSCVVVPLMLYLNLQKQYFFLYYILILYVLIKQSLLLSFAIKTPYIIVTILSLLRLNLLSSSPFKWTRLSHWMKAFLFRPQRARSSSRPAGG